MQTRSAKGIVQFAIAWAMPHIGRDTKLETLINLHFSLGVVVLLVLVIRRDKAGLSSMALFWQNSRARGGTAENWADDVGAHVTDIEAIRSETFPEALKPCPFCGGRPYFVGTGHGLGYVIRCGQCSARVDSDAGKQDAIRQWQSRARERVP